MTVVDEELYFSGYTDAELWNVQADSVAQVGDIKPFLGRSATPQIVSCERCALYCNRDFKTAISAANAGSAPQQSSTVGRQKSYQFTKCGFCFRHPSSEGNTEVMVMA